MTMMRKMTAALLALLLALAAVPAMGEALETFDVSTALLGIEMAASSDIPDWPELNEKGFYDGGEFVHEDAENGVWMYASSTLKVQIFRYHNPSKPLTWYESEIWCDTDSEYFHTVINDPDKPLQKTDPINIATANKVVFAVNADYYSYRATKKGKTTLGVLVREGKIVADDPYPNNYGSFPNLDCLALFPDGDMRVFLSAEHTAQEYLDMGATDVLAFGPYMIRDGVINPKIADYGRTKQPRACIGMIEKGHYISFMMESRTRDSKGETIAYMANIMKDKGCQTVFNLDGGQTAVVLFMGKQLNVIGLYDGHTNPRAQSEVLGIGTTALMN